MIFDCFLYCGERDVLDIRLEELRGVVDVFVIVEATHTFQGERRELEHPDLGAPTVRVDVTDVLPEDPWRAESFVRNAIVWGLHDAGPDDIVLISDADEVPSSLVVSTLHGQPDIVNGHGPVALENTSYYFTLDWQVPWRHDLHPVAIRADVLRQPEHARRNPVAHLGGGPFADDPTVGTAGWHFGWLGGVDVAMRKLAAFAHAEYRELSREHVEACIRDGIDLFGRGQLLPAEIDATYPECVRRAPERWTHLLRQRKG